MKKGEGGLLGDIRVMAVLLCVFAALLVIYVYPPPPADAGINGNLRYGLDLVGGSSLQLKLEGTLVKINTTSVNESEVVEFLEEELDTEVTPYKADDGGVVYEIRKSVTKEQLLEVLRGINADIAKKPNGEDFFEDSITRATRDETRRIIETKINMLGLASTTIRTVGDNLMIIDLAGIDIRTARDMVGKPGKFEIRIQTNGTKGDIAKGQRLEEIENITAHVMYGSAGIESVGTTPTSEIRKWQGEEFEEWGAPFALNEEGATALRDSAIEFGAVANPDDHELAMLLDNVVVYSASIADEACEKLKEGVIYRWTANTGSEEEGRKKARELIIHLKAGALPVNVDIIGSGEVPAYLGAKFKNGALIAGLLALISVTGVVFLRYREPKIVLPMFFALFSEVVLILGFVAAINWLIIGTIGMVIILSSIGAIMKWWQYSVTDLIIGLIILLFVLIPILAVGGWQLELSSIAGVIVVIGTGVDQLVIITDEVLSGGRSSAKMYRKRISFAFSIIFVSAFTTIVAMAALFLMALGTLRGFAIVTIVGLIIGIFITRPAYARVIEAIV